jgi:hypothetical protein
MLFIIKVRKCLVNEDFVLYSTSSRRTSTQMGRVPCPCSPRLKLRLINLQKKGVDPFSNPKSNLKLLSAVERLRKVLSGGSDGSLHVECLVDRLGVDSDS